VALLQLEHRSAAHRPHTGCEPIDDNMIIPLMSVMHGQCDSRPMVTFPACAAIKLILLGDRGTCVNRLYPKAWRPIDRNYNALPPRH